MDNYALHNISMQVISFLEDATKQVPKKRDIVGELALKTFSNEEQDKGESHTLVHLGVSKKLVADFGVVVSCQWLQW